MGITVKLIISLVLFVLTIVRGAILSKKGKPYNQAAYNVHKLSALIAVVLAVWAIVEVIKSSIPEITAVIMLILAAAAVLVLFVTGALFTIRKSNYSLMKGIHITGLMFLIISAGAAFYLLR